MAAHSIGSVVVTATYGDVSGTSTITVTQPCGPGEVPDDTGKCESIQAALSSGFFMRFGLSAGVAVAVHSPLPGHDSATYISGAAVAPLAYVAGFPAYWAWSRDRATHCSRSILEDSTPVAKRATHELLATRPDAAQADGKGTKDSFCLLGDIGFFVGVPSSFQTNTVLNSSYAVTNPGSRTIRPLVSFGVALAPFPWINLLVGLTYSNVQTDTFPGAPLTGPKSVPPDLQLCSLLFGVGGPFDLASLLIGGK